MKPDTQKMPLEEIYTLLLRAMPEVANRLVAGPRKAGDPVQGQVRDDG